MEISPCHNSVADHQIATKFCTCHDSTAVVPCTKLCSNHCIRIEVRVKRNSHRVWIAMEKPLVKRGPVYKAYHFLRQFYGGVKSVILMQDFPNYLHYSDVIMSAIAFQITGVPIVCSTVCSGADQGKYQSSASLAFVRGIHLSPVDSPHKRPVTQKIVPFDDAIMVCVHHGFIEDTGTSTTVNLHR